HSARIAAELGRGSGEDLWIVGRAGVIGDGDADVAAAGLAFLAPERVRSAWESLPDGLSHRQVADAYAALCAQWGATELARVDQKRMAKPDELGRHIDNAAETFVVGVFC